MKTAFRDSASVLDMQFWKIYLKTYAHFEFVAIKHFKGFWKSFEREKFGWKNVLLASTSKWTNIWYGDMNVV